MRKQPGYCSFCSRVVDLHRLHFLRKAKLRLLQLKQIQSPYLGIEVTMSRLHVSLGGVVKAFILNSKDFKCIKITDNLLYFLSSRACPKHSPTHTALPRNIPPRWQAFQIILRHGSSKFKKRILNIFFNIVYQMKKLVNPTTYFFEQAERVSEQVNPEIEKFKRSLINLDNCDLCRQPYDTKKRIPRILIHCGHTFCTPCLQEFYTNRRVRCPMCLKLVKHLDNLDRLPINHTVFTNLVEKNKKLCEEENKKPQIEDAGKYIYSEFEKVQKEAHRLENPVKIDPASGLPFCAFHPDRVEHFYCKSHKGSGCRVCIEIGHSRPDCEVLDLYTVDDPDEYLNPQENENILEQRIEEDQFFGSFNPVPSKNGMRLLMNKFDQDDDGGQKLLDDESDSVKSF